MKKLLFLAFAIIGMFAISSRASSQSTTVFAKLISGVVVPQLTDSTMKIALAIEIGNGAIFDSVKYAPVGDTLYIFGFGHMPSSDTSVRVGVPILLDGGGVDYRTTAGPRRHMCQGGVCSACEFKTIFGYIIYGCQCIDGEPNHKCNHTIWNDGPNYFYGLGNLP